MAIDGCDAGLQALKALLCSGELQLLQQWQEQLQLPIQRGLLLLASDPQEWERQQRLVQQSQCLELLSPADLKQRINQATLPELPDGVLGGVWSGGDGQLDPMQWIQQLQLSAAEQGLERLLSLIHISEPTRPY